MKQFLTRQELYDLVWAKSMTTLAKEFGISSVALAKWCRRYDIPAPPRGHWAKSRAGKRTVRLPLPPRGLGMSEEIRDRRPYRRSYYVEPEDLIHMEIPPP